MNDILDQCSIQELIKFDVTKESSSPLTIFITALACVIINNFVFTIGMKHFASKEFKDTLEDEHDQEFDQYKEKQISPLIFGFSEFLNSGIYAPLVEELFFRFLFLKLVLIKIFKFNIHTANLIHAVIFGAMHMTNAVVSDQQINRTIIQSCMAGIGGLVSGYAYIYTNSIFTPLIAHIINNMMAAGQELIEYANSYAQRVALRKKH
jgi:membrane protease YdiL (CAAX protease family)